MEITFISCGQYYTAKYETRKYDYNTITFFNQEGVCVGVAYADTAEEVFLAISRFTHEV